MDQLASQTIKQVYSYCYEQALSFNITIMPTPDTFGSAVSTVGYTMYRNCPESIQVYYDNFMSLSVVPVFLTLVVLYILFSLIMATLRGVFRLVYNFVRFTLMLSLVITLIGIAQQYYGQGSSLPQFIFDSLPQLREQYEKSYPSSL